MMRLLALLVLLAACRPAVEDDGDTDNDGWLDAEDCDPRNGDAYPGAPDPYGDDRDQDCDGMDGVDVDNDGYPANVRSNPTHWLLWDCDDGDPAVHPGVADPAGDGIDTNCDELDGVDADRDDHASIASGGDDCDDDEPAISPSEPDLVGDGRDRDCDGVDGEDDDRDGVAATDSGGTDCDDTDPAIHPGAFDACDGVHADCMVSPAELDQDGDGFMPCEGDCADSDPARHPGAVEACDAGDLNCDGVAGSTDADGDGVTGCAGDCDDGDPAVHPGAPEGCDGLDGDCSGAPAASEADADGDGLPTCAGDCDDGDAAIHPGAWDGPGGADEDCDGDVGAASLGWLEVTGSAADAFGAVLASGDFDGDGLADLAVGAPGTNDVGSFNQGRVYVFPGTVLAAGGAVDAASAPRILQGEAGLDFAGSALAVGDFDGDGLDDLAVGAFGNDAGGQNAGRVYVVSGAQLAASGVSGLAAVSTVLTGAGLDAQAGEALAAGDIDGDGRADLVVGSSGTTGSGPWTGSALVLFGGSIAAGSLAAAPLVLAGGGEGAFAGSSVGAGDVDGDGDADVLVGAPGADVARLYFASSLPASGTVQPSAAGRTFPGGGPSARVGEGAALLADVDGDGRAEVALRVDGSSSSSWSVWRSAVLGSAADFTIAGAATVAAGSDAEGDGRAELVVAWGAESGVFLSSSLGPGGALVPAGADLVVEGSGGGVVGLGDATGDGAGEIALGGGGAVGLWPGGG
jgi:hypothetical protein